MLFFINFSCQFLIRYQDNLYLKKQSNYLTGTYDKDSATDFIIKMSRSKKIVFTDTKSDLLLTYSSKKDKLKFTDLAPNLFFNVYVDSNDYLHFITNRNEQMIFDEKRRVFSLRKEVKDSYFSFVDRESDKEIKIPFLAQKIQDSSDDHEFIEYTKVNTRHKPIQLKRSPIKNRSKMDYNGKILDKK